MKLVSLGSGLLVCVVMSSLVSLALAEEGSTTPVGYWKTVDRKTQKPSAIVRVWQLNGELHGRIEKLINPPEKDPVCSKCPGAMRNKPIQGLDFLWGFKREGAGWSDGKVLDPEDGKIYDANLEVIDAGRRMKVFGYTRIIIKVGETEIWERVSPEQWGISPQ